MGKPTCQISSPSIRIKEKRSVQIPDCLVVFLQVKFGNAPIKKRVLVDRVISFTGVRNLNDSLF